MDFKKFHLNNPNQLNYLYQKNLISHILPYQPKFSMSRKHVSMIKVSFFHTNSQSTNQLFKSNQNSKLTVLIRVYSTLKNHLRVSNELVAQLPNFYINGYNQNQDPNRTVTITYQTFDLISHISHCLSLISLVFTSDFRVQSSSSLFTLSFDLLKLSVLYLALHLSLIQFSKSKP